MIVAAKIDRLSSLAELALSWRMKHLPRHHLKRWYGSTPDYSFEDSVAGFGHVDNVSSGKTLNDLDSS